MAICTLHFYSLEGERRLSVQTWTLIPSYGRKAGFPLSGLMLVLPCFHTAFQSTQCTHISQPAGSIRWTIKKVTRITAMPGALSCSARLLSPQRPLRISQQPSVPGLFPSPSCPFFKDLLLPATSSCFWVSSKVLKISLV